MANKVVVTNDRQKELCSIFDERTGIERVLDCELIKKGPIDRDELVKNVTKLVKPVHRYLSGAKGPGTLEEKVRRMVKTYDMCDVYDETGAEDPYNMQILSLTEKIRNRRIRQWFEYPANVDFLLLVYEGAEPQCEW